MLTFCLFHIIILLRGRIADNTNYPSKRYRTAIIYLMQWPCNIILNIYALQHLLLHKYTWYAILNKEGVVTIFYQEELGGTVLEKTC